MKSEFERFLMTVSCRDCDSIPKVADAGMLLEHQGQTVQIMHDGTRVMAGGYGGGWMVDVIRSLRGHHEPQEELAFHHLLRYVRCRSVMVELGAWWAYYTNWYLRAIPLSTALCVEPVRENIDVGLANLRLNGNSERAKFVKACAGGGAGSLKAIPGQSGNAKLPRVDMDAILGLLKGQTVELLHMDVQGAELPFIQSMRQSVATQRVRFLVASTHHELISGSRTTHQDCIDELRGMGAHILCEHSVSESFSGDGLIVASFFAADRAIELPPVSLNRAPNALFG